MPLAVRRRLAPHAARARALHAQARAAGERGVLRAVPRGPAQLQARSRQEKLAAMGRMSAGIAHEIRNPLAAIAQANALLAEDADRPGAAPADAHGDRERRAAEAHRRRRDGSGARASCRTSARSTPRAQVAAVCGDWAQRRGRRSSASSSVLRVELPAEPLGVLFDAEHLRRVLVNLLDNALRHASDARRRDPAAPATRATTAGPRCSVLSDGAPIAGRRRALSVRALLLDAQPRQRPGPVHLPRAVRAPRRHASTTALRRPTAGRERNEFFVDMRRSRAPADTIADA